MTPQFGTRPVAATSVPEVGFEVLNPLARRYFNELPHAGTLSQAALAASDRLLRGEAGRESNGTRVVFHIALSKAGRVTEVRFQAYGCPHTLATAAWLAGQLYDRTFANLLPSAPADWAEQLGVPIEKLGRLLLIEDALRALA